ncbi:MAG: serine/threonine-protein kinase, partial [Acidobacteriota bacterium]
MPSLVTGPQPESMGLPSEGPRLVADRYEILRLLGRGRMGEVYLADDHRGRKHVALKFCARDCGKDFHRLLVREVRLGQRVTHPNVCRIYDLDTHGDQIFLAMEFIDGSTLRQILDRTLGRLTCAERLRIAYGLCDGLAAIHGQHVLHRDLKPGNVMLDSAGRTVITDFGLAVQAHGAADQSGTPGYMAPELATGGPPSVQSDLFSLGLVLYELFTDRRTEYTEQRGRGPLEALDVPPDSNVPPEIFEVILRCLNRDPDKRPESAAAVAKDLPTPMLERESGESITSPATLLVLPRFTPSRIRSRWTLAALLVTVVVASLLGARWGPATALVDPPPVLEKSARDILRDLGFPPAPYRAWGFWHPSSWEGWGDERVPLVHLDSLVFWYRQGPRPIIQRQLGNPVLIPDDPPISDPGSVRVVLDASGTLLR